MQHRTLTSIAAIAAAALASTHASAQSAGIPHDFEASTAPFQPLFSYFGGVQSFGVEQSATAAFSGNSLRCWANFRHDNIFRVAGFAVGTLGVNRTSGMFNFPPDASTFSITVRSPDAAAPAGYSAGQLQMVVTLREDDDGDGVIDIAESDDEWDSPYIAIQPGTAVYNIPLADFIDTDTLVGNNTQNFGTTGRIACLITFETRTTYPGGIIETPRELFIDHVGLFAAPQSLPAPACPGDFNGQNGVTLQDLFDYLNAWFAGATDAEFDNAPGITLQDLFDFLTAWFSPCP